MTNRRGDMTVREFAGWLHDAHERGALLDAGHVAGGLVTDADRVAWDLDLAYRVQDELHGLRAATGRQILGYKLGYTSAAMRTQMGVPAPNYGPLYTDMVLADGEPADRFVQPRVEPEIAVVLKRDLAGSGLQLHEIAQAVGSVRACFEIVDSVWRDYRFTAELNTADGSSAAGVVLGPDLGIDPLECHRLSVTVRSVNGILATASGAAASGHPLLGVAWLCSTLERRGLPGLSAGQVVITGGLTSAVELPRGAQMFADFSSGVSVSLRRS